MIGGISRDGAKSNAARNLAADMLFRSEARHPHSYRKQHDYEERS